MEDNVISIEPALSTVIETGENVKATRPLMKLLKIRDYVQSQVLEREHETTGAILAILSGTECLFLGEPGAAKTMHVTLLSEFMGLRMFDILMSDTTKPESIFGPIDVPALAKGTQRYKIDGYAPDSEILFFDEIFKASGIILNTLLQILNERKFRNGDEGMLKCPVVACFAASNEVPLDKASRPIYDRFLLRYNVSYLSSSSSIHKLFRNALYGKGTMEKPEKLTHEDLLYMQNIIKDIEFPYEVQTTMIKIRDLVRKAGVQISDRRLAKSLRVIQAHAYINGRRTVDTTDLSVLADILWDDPSSASKIRSIVLSIADSKSGDIQSLLDTAQDIAKKADESGGFEDAYKKLQKLLDKSSKFTTSAGMQVHGKIKGIADDIHNMIETRKNFVVFFMDAQTGKQEDNIYKLSPSTAELWTQKEIRSAGFHYRRSQGYWYRDKTTMSQIESDVAAMLNVNAVFKQIV